MSSTYNQAGNGYDSGQYEDLSVERFVLDSSTLDTNGIGLDGPFPFTTTATGAASLGALAASAIGTVTRIVTAVAAAPLGELVAEVAEVIVTVDAEADATLGGLTAAADGIVTIVALASAGLGDATSSATGTVSKVASAEGLLGGVVAAATGTVIPIGSMTANLGGLDGTAIGTVIPQPSPQPTTGGAPYPYRRSPRKKKVEPIIEVLEPETVMVPIKTVEAYCTPIVAGVYATASGSVTFIAEDDDLQVILML